MEENNKLVAFMKIYACLIKIPLNMLVEWFVVKRKSRDSRVVQKRLLPMSRKQIKIQRRMTLCQRLPCAKGAVSEAD